MAKHLNDWTPREVAEQPNKAAREMWKAAADIDRMQLFQDETAKAWTKLTESQEREIEQLRSLLGCALSEHDANNGEFAPDYMPHHWTHQARAALASSKRDR